MRQRRSTYLPPPILVAHRRRPAPAPPPGERLARHAESPLLAYIVIGGLTTAILTILLVLA